MEQQLNSSTGGWIGDDRRDEADFIPVSQTIAKPNVKCSAIVTDAELTEAWGNANFGNVSKHDVIIDTLKKVAQAWGTGHTAMCIVKELGLVESRNNQVGLSDKGLMYLLASVGC